jgi:hypothetical protein
MKKLLGFDYDICNLPANTWHFTLFLPLTKINIIKLVS